MIRLLRFIVPVMIALLPAGLSAREAVAEAVVLHGDKPGPVYNKRLFGQFAEHLGTGIYGGVWVGPGSDIPNVDGYRTDVLEALRAIRVPQIRWPGGCFADEYRWREGVGARNQRPVKVNRSWGGVTEDNSFGTHEFMNFAEMVGAEAFISGNVGSVPPAEMAEWIEYMTSPTTASIALERAKNGREKPWKVPAVGIGNELWGCGGSMRTDYAADLTRQYATFIKVPMGEQLMKVASGPNGGAVGVVIEDDGKWTDTMMRIAGVKVDALGAHFYTVSWDASTKSFGWSATGFGEKDWAGVLQRASAVDGFLTKHSRIMDKYDPDRRVALLLDEWGSWYKNTPGTNPSFLQQQNTLRDALVASITFDIFAKHADRVRGANIAQMVNVLQAMMLTDGKRMVKTPTYWAFDLYKDYQDATVLPVVVTARKYVNGNAKLARISASAVRSSDGIVHVGLTNVDPNIEIDVVIRLDGLKPNAVSGRILTASAIDAHNSFDAPNVVIPRNFEGVKREGAVLTVTLPAKSVVMLDLR